MEITGLLMAVAGLAMTVVASRWVVRHASMLAYGLDVPPYFIGITLLALGTDGPEIANSVMASLAGHGDLNVGNGTGSVFAQITLVLGLLPFTGKNFMVGRPWRTAAVPLLTIAALAISGLLFFDGYFSRLDGAVLVAAWAGGTALAWRYAQPFSEPEMLEPAHSKLGHLLLMTLSLVLVAGGAAAAVTGLTEVSAAWGIPEYLISFFGSSVGTSLPEIVVTIQAMRLGQRDLAMGDILGACLLDASLSPGIGPLLAPTPIDAGLAVRGVQIAMLAMAAVTALLWGRGRHDRRSAAVLLAIYLAGYFILI